MCGLWGVIQAQPTILENMRRFIWACATAGTIRGDHGTGVFVARKNVVETYKAAVDGANFMYHKGAKELLETRSLASAWAVAGHNRAATSGDLDDASAHPFQHKHILLMQNGNVYQPSNLAGIADYSTVKDRVDSDVLAEAIAAKGYETIIPHAYGAHALCWHDSTDNTVRFVRNAQRPLHFMRAGCGALLWASEPDMLWWAAGRANFRRTEVRELDTGIVLTVNEKGEATAKPLPAAVYPTYNRHGETGGTGGNSGSSGTIEGKTFTFAPTQRGSLAKMGLSAASRLNFTVGTIEHWHGQQARIFGMAEDLNGRGTPYPSVMFIHNPTIAEGDVVRVKPTGLYKGKIPGVKKRESIVMVDMLFTTVQRQAREKVVDLYPGPKNSYLTKQAWLEVTSHGCCECHRAITSDEAEEVVWMHNDTRPCCPDCVKVWQELEAEATAARAGLLLQ